jgi:hypothetical protein
VGEELPGGADSVLAAVPGGDGELPPLKSLGAPTRLPAPATRLVGCEADLEYRRISGRSPVHAAGGDGPSRFRRPP